ncbi:Dihydroorotate dehydrogenase (NAD(+)), electron transfer subunit [Candidatus Syntrophocurvum alkaliphilum]|uniref:Dihydroorotate dehydrogenase B (NAD(+)), electron transfer subunit n=1 Tax=Candidatus Syntrophocurvum alkaliphilum TaxID=2293317 RepID=A0A6I6DEN1_9FIRM|nr:dihydroorotate dehydrogenase electron transfer subunit [Candidatus Syntrophocurvum alkaliphilum]QGT99666.1 Dihydroorotate dehydrogenase (NAD(+)), electron transfer subunit [Candidatus Syntrophocurvum alkaliphilum]
MPSLANGLVVGHRKLSKDMYELEFIAPEIANECKPGQYINLKVGNELDPLLRRPLSLYDVDKRLGSITLLYKVVGKGTQILTRTKVKEYVDVMGPLGRGFKILEEKSNALLIGGGVGIAPLVYLARVLKDNNCNVQVLHGTDTKNNLVDFNKLEEIGVEYILATDDGSFGFKGFVTDFLKEKINPKEIDYIYCCGPEPMMAEVAKYALVNNIDGEVSLEEHMACGVGACLGCARKLKSKDELYVKVCKDGPVFNINEVELNK